jgi:type IX secretion system PorP/SprF family membrane protein
MNKTKCNLLLMRKILSALLLLCSLTAFSQQMPHFSQYFLNDFAINPAVAGSRGFLEIQSNHRSQWVGITDAPRTFTLSCNSPIAYDKMGLGGLVFSDIVGPTRRIGINGSYAYHLNITEQTKLSMGLSAGILHFAIDGSKISLRDQGDNYFSNGIQSVVVPDFGFGLYLYNDNYFIGASAPQLNQSKLKFFANTESRAKLEDHYYISGSYKFPMGESFHFQPLFIVKYITPTPVQFDVTARVIFQEKIWIGTTWRSRDAISGMLGFIYQENLLFGYSYDYTISGLQNYSSGTHEIMLGLRFGSIKTSPVPSIE